MDATSSVAALTPPTWTREELHEGVAGSVTAARTFLERHQQQQHGQGVMAYNEQEEEQEGTSVTMGSTAATSAARSSSSFHVLQQTAEEGAAILPLHWICMQHPSVEVVELFVRHFPNGLRCKDADWGMLPLHWACRFGGSLDVIQFLTTQYPAALYETEWQKQTPLHLLIERQSHDIVEWMVTVYPKTLLNLGPHGRLPIHWCLQRPLSLQIVRLLVQRSPVQVFTTRCHHGWIPLYYALRCGFQGDILEHMIAKAPESLLVQDRVHCDMPLHLALRLAAPPNVIRLLMDQPAACEALAWTDRHGRYTVHMAIHWEVSTETLQVLIEQSRNATILQLRDREGRLPFHTAVQHKRASVATIRLLLDHYSDALSMVDNFGSWPIKTAIRQKASVDVIELLVDYSLRIGALPNEPHGVWHLLRYALLSKASGNLISMLLRKCPYQDLTRQDPSTGQTLLHLAVTNHAPADTVDCIMQSTATTTTTAPEATMETETFDSPANMKETTLTSSSKNTDLVLLHMVDHQGCLPLHRAAQVGADLCVMRMLVEPNPGACRVADQTPSKLFPLHAALEGKQTSLEMIQYLVQKDFDTLSMRDGCNRLPLHVAAASKQSLQVIYYLTQCAPHLLPTSCELMRVSSKYTNQDGTGVNRPCRRSNNAAVAKRRSTAMEHLNGIAGTCTSTSNRTTTSHPHRRSRRRQQLQQHHHHQQLRRKYSKAK